jgi:ADP-heptose:LPS heptosyltransferase
LSKEIKKVLVIKLGALGDFVLALAAMKKIREAHPRAKITLLTTPPFEALAKLSPYFNTVETDGRPGDFGELTAMLGRAAQGPLRPRLRPADQQPHQLVLPGPAAVRAAMVGHRDGLLAAPARQGPLPHAHAGTAGRPVEAGRHLARRPHRAGRRPAPDLSWILRRTKEPRPVAGAAAPRPYVLLVPGGSAHRPEKRWPVESYAQLAALLKARGLDIVIIGGPQESAMARQIQKAVGQARDLTGRTDFAQLAVLGAKAALTVGNDTGPTHLLAAAGAPTIALFSDASDPELCGPRGHVAVIRSPDLKALPVSTVASAAISLLPH